MRVITVSLLAARLAIRSTWRNPRRSVITLLAIILGIGSTITLVSFARGVSNQIVRDAIYHFTGHIQIRAQGYTDDPSIDYRFAWPDPTILAALQTIPAAKWAARLRLPSVIVSERDSHPLTVLGIEPAAEVGLSLAGKPPAAGQGLTGSQDTGVVLGQELIKDLHSELNRRVVIMTQSVENQVADRGFRIKAEFTSNLESIETGYALTGLRTLQDLVGASGAISEISILLEQESQLDRVREALQSKLPHLAVTTWRDIEPMAAALTKLQSAFLIVWFSIIVFAVSAGLMNTMFMAIYERIKEIALMQAIGTPVSVLFLQVVFESLFLLLLGAILGSMAGIGGYYAISGGVDITPWAAGGEMMGLSRVIYPKLLLDDLIDLNIILFGLGLLGTIYPAWYAANKEPIRELQR